MCTLFGMEQAVTNNSHTRLLIVDDEPAIVNILRTLLEGEGYQIATALSGEAALEEIKVEPVDVLITDIRMDGMTGFDLMAATRDLDRHMRVIVITAHDCYDMISNALRHGAYDYLTKPLDDHEVILNSISRAANAARLGRDNAKLLEQVSASHAMIEEANRRLRELNEELMVQASTDGLTNIYNRRYLENSLEHEVNRRNRYPDALSLVMLDIDRFKNFNDDYGHAGGDTALQVLSRVMTSSARNIDVIGRYGGEEFLIILPKTPPENALIFAERLQRSIETTPINIGNQLTRLTASIGVAGVETEHPKITAEQLKAAADSALYVAKAEGRNCVRQCLDLSECVDQEVKKAG